MKTFSCQYCNSTDIYIEEHGPHIGLYCADCGKWLQWLNKEELRLAQRQIKKNENSH